MPRRVYVYGKTRAEANTKLRVLLDRAEKSIPVAPAALTVGDYLSEWVTHIRQHVRPSTYASYESNVRLHITPLIGRKKLTRLGSRDVRMMIDQLRKDGKLPRSIL